MVGQRQWPPIVFHNPTIDAQEILSGHTHATLERIRAQEIVVPDADHAEAALAAFVEGPEHIPP